MAAGLTGGPRPAPQPAPKPAPQVVPPAAHAPAAKARDPFGFGVESPSAPPPGTEDDWSDIDVVADAPAEPAPAAPAPRASIEAAPAPIELPAPAAEKVELAPMHAFVPPAAETGHKPEPVAAPGADGGEAQLRDAIGKASREVIEKIAWEVVPQLAETIIREHLDRLVKERQGQ